MEPISFQKTESPDSEKIIRRSLLPWWIKTFCWIFMIMGTITPVIAIVGLFGIDAQLSIYGFQTNKHISILGLLIISILVFKGIAAYALWLEKDNAINLARIDAVCGVVLCVIAMFVMPFVTEGYHFTFRLELLLLILYFRKINRIEYEWDNREAQ